jgi:hypothetical protein
MRCRRPLMICRRCCFHGMWGMTRRSNSGMVSLLRAVVEHQCTVCRWISNDLQDKRSSSRPGAKLTAQIEA